MDPATIALLAPLAEKLIIVGGMALVGWIGHRHGSANVQAVSQAIPATTQAAVGAAVSAATAGAKPADIAKAAGIAAAGAVVAALPQVTVTDPTAVAK